MKIGIDREKVNIIEEIIRQDIASGNIAPGEKILPLDLLARQYRITRIEAAAVLRRLRRDKLIVSLGRKGLFVMADKPAKTIENTIGLIFNGAASAASQRVIRGMENVLAVNGYDLLQKSTGNSQSKEEKILKSLISGNAAGYIIEPSKSQLLCRHMYLYHKLDELQKPYVFIRSAYPQMIDKPKVIIDDSQGGYMLTRHMIATIGESIVGIFRADDSRGAERHRGYVKALQEAGIPYRPELVIWYHLEERMKKPVLALDQILAEHVCDGIICYNDTMATNIMYHLFQSGYSVPEDIAVAGYGNTAVATAGELGLTTIAQPDELLGEIAAETLLEILRGETEPGKKLEKTLNPELVIRGSTVSGGI